jgi:epoxide hydrolase-like predicted phosphatase
MKTKIKPQIKAIAFDIGGVLDKGKITNHYESTCKSLGISVSKFYKIREKYLPQARTGKISDEKYVSLIAKYMGVTYSDLLTAWIKEKKRVIAKDKKVEKIIKRLKKNGYCVGTLTNIIKLHHKIRIQKGLYDLFDFKICSFEVKLEKPDIRIYKLLIKKLNLKPEEIIFIDDEIRYILPAKKLGIKTIHFKNANQLKKDLIKLGVEVK